VPENTLVNQVKIWANNAFAKKADFTWASRGVPDRFRPLMLNKDGKLDRSLIIAGSGAVLDSYTDNVGFLAVSGAFVTQSGAPGHARVDGAYGLRYYSPATGGWARGFQAMKSDQVTSLGTFGALGNSDALLYMYVGTAYNVTFQEWTAAESTIRTDLSVVGDVYGVAINASAGGYGTGHMFNGVANAGFFGASNYIGMTTPLGHAGFITRLDANPSYTNIGIGNTNDQYARLSLYTYGASATTATAYLDRAAGANGILQLVNTGTGILGLLNVGASAINFGTSNAWRMYIDANGLVGIGVTPATQKLKVLGSVAVGGDEGGTASYTTFTNATVAASTGTVTVKSRTASNVNTTGFLKVYVGTAAKYVPYVD